ncbi:Streptogramin A acetyltransferase [Jannaschia seosinensis]|uniref:Streptogramin A acetyltransferase n=1 Tax=Jannaschia seosinensis TaxID=313367 RepID=A0A0M7BG50_9RHOB|nr:CatB-related O-acetyltransferase [Jannaschia seosinensis]CUH40762.1 Streptogramin A acetyltransferase [Jannaschia seosinensis]
MNGPDPDVLTPMPSYDGLVFLRALARGRTNVTVGRYAYYDDRDRTRDFFDRNVIHHHDFVGDHLTIGPFCAIAYGVTIMMDGGGHVMDGLSTYPFNIFGHGWEAGFDPEDWAAVRRGDTEIGPDVWIGDRATILPGVKIGAGAVVAAMAVVTKDVAPYAIVAGNPARELRRRFDADIIARLLDVAWWDWSTARITRNIDAIRGADIAALEAAT